MPDGRLKLTKFQKRWKTNTAENRLRKEPVMNRADFDERFARWWDEYAAITDDPKPNFYQWFARVHPDVLGKELLWAVFDKGRRSAAEKAIRTWLEHGLEKPKTQLEVSNADAQIPEYSNEDILKMVLEEMGIDYAEFQEKFGNTVEARKLN